MCFKLRARLPHEFSTCHVEVLQFVPEEAQSIVSRLPQPSEALMEGGAFIFGYPKELSVGLVQDKTKGACQLQRRPPPEIHLANIVGIMALVSRDRAISSQRLPSDWRDTKVMADAVFDSCLACALG